jgi:hypothetical protein
LYLTEVRGQRSVGAAQDAGVQVATGGLHLLQRSGATLLLSDLINVVIISLLLLLLLYDYFSCGPAWQVLVDLSLRVLCECVFVLV